jgi:cytochrome c-type biogenesis protein CcmH
MTRRCRSGSAATEDMKASKRVGHLGRGRAAPTVLALFFAMNLAFAQVVAPTVPVADPALEARVKSLSSELRCLVCQNQTVADSDAPVARDMREQVRTQLASGKSEAEVKRYMTERFGDFVLYKPAFNASTVVLWAAPFAALSFGVIVLLRRLRANAQPTSASEAPLSATDRERARALLSTEENK